MGAARAYAMGLLARRERSCAELVQRLTARGYAPRLTAAVVAGLAGEGLVSDQRYATERVRVRAEQGVGPLRIHSELRERGLASETIAAALDVTDPLWAERASRARRKRFGAALPQDRTERARQARFLQGRGFSFEQITFAVSAPPT